MLSWTRDFETHGRLKSRDQRRATASRMRRVWIELCSKCVLFSSFLWTLGPFYFSKNRSHTTSIIADSCSSFFLKKYSERLSLLIQFFSSIFLIRIPLKSVQDYFLVIPNVSKKITWYKLYFFTDVINLLRKSIWIYNMWQ